MYLEEIIRLNKLFAESGGNEGKRANLRNAYLMDALLQETDLRGALLQGAILKNACLRYANLEKANLMDADLKYAKLSGANLQEAFLQGANLIDADLYKSDLQGANLIDADLRHAKLKYANLTGANLWGALTQAADVRGAIASLSNFIAKVPDLSGLPKVLLEHIGTPMFEQSFWGNECGTPCCLAGKAAQYVGRPGNSGIGVIAIKEAMPNFDLDVLYEDNPDEAIAELKRHIQ